MSDYYKGIIEDIKSKAQKHLEEHERNYQDTGSSRTYAAIIKNDNIITICNLALEAIDGNCHNCKRKNRLIVDMINRYEKLRETGNTIDIEKVIHDLINIRY